MILEIISIKDRGNLQKERVVFSVVQDGNVNGLIFLDSTYGKGGQISNHHRHAFLFPSLEVTKGQIIRVYTRAGKQDNKPFVVASKSNPENHKLYWGLAATIWNKDGETALLVHLNAGQALKVC